jgi:hypothetical protein
VEVRKWQDRVVEVQATTADGAKIVALDLLAEDSDEFEWQTDEHDILDVEEVEE